MKLYGGIPRFRYDELVAMPTITQGWDADLKYDDGARRVWLQRTTPADGEPFKHTATIERYVRARGDQGTDTWQTLYQYDADHTSRIKEETHG